MEYSEETINRFRNPKHSGDLKNANAVGQVGNVRCGDVMKLSLEIDKNDVIKDVKFKTFGCMAAIAASDMMCELAKGKTVEEAKKITAKDISKELGDLPPIKHHCSILGTEALEKALKDYEEKKNDQ